ncbi:amidase [Candidatus Palauibacter sp.]|uniref:amidase n=1 Tax=Candidatus Palauibacter sp. TaxID=3101350 RepID=UPI003B028ECB
MSETHETAGEGAVDGVGAGAVDGGIRRRGFLKVAAAATAAGALDPRTLVAAGTVEAGASRTAGPLAAQTARQASQEEVIPLRNGEPPALQFQAYPGGTGALLEKYWRAGMNPFERTPIEIEPWQGTVPTSEEEVAFLPVHRLAALVRERHLSPMELYDIYMERMKRYDPTLLCAVTILEGRGREEAEQAESEIRAGEWRGPLHGIPWGVKDLFSTVGARTTWGSAAFQTQMIEEDAEVVRRLGAAGAVLIAKLATGEFARGDRWYRGRTLNPWNLAWGSSGSSAGPGSATAAGCVAFSIGTETRGSIVSPSRRNGLSALRPTFGRVSRYGGMVLSWSMDKTGPMCRTIEDCALVFNEIHGADEKDPASITMPFRFEREPDLGSLSIGYMENAPRSFIEKLEELGARPRLMRDLPAQSASSLGAQSASAFDFHVAPDGELPPVPEGLSESERRDFTRFRGGRDGLAMDYVHAQRRRHIVMKRMAEAMDGFDMFVTGSGEVGLTNETGHPAAVVQYGFGPAGPEGEEADQPLTTTLIGDLFTDDKILSVAHAFQSATDWHTRHPALD